VVDQNAMEPAAGSLNGKQNGCMKKSPELETQGTCAVAGLDRDSACAHLSIANCILQAQGCAAEVLRGAVREKMGAGVLEAVGKESMMLPGYNEKNALGISKKTLSVGGGGGDEVCVCVCGYSSEGAISLYTGCKPSRYTKCELQAQTRPASGKGSGRSRGNGQVNCSVRLDSIEKAGVVSNALRRPRKADAIVATRTPIPGYDGHETDVGWAGRYTRRACGIHTLEDGLPALGKAARRHDPI
jgi:hypothetical protein